MAPGRGDADGGDAGPIGRPGEHQHGKGGEEPERAVGREKTRGHAAKAGVRCGGPSVHVRAGGAIECEMYKNVKFLPSIPRFLDSSPSSFFSLF